VNAYMYLQFTYLVRLETWVLGDWVMSCLYWARSFTGNAPGNFMSATDNHFLHIFYIFFAV